MPNKQNMLFCLQAEGIPKLTKILVDNKYFFTIVFPVNLINNIYIWSAINAANVTTQKKMILENYE